MGFHRAQIFCVAAVALFAVGASTVAADAPDAAVGRAYAHVPHQGRKLFQTPVHSAEQAKLQSQGPHLANRRTLLQAMCPEHDNSVDAVIGCTNAMRENPGAFRLRCSPGGGGGLGPLRKNAKLILAGQRHAEDNARMGDLTHFGSDGSRPSQRVSRAGYKGGAVRENIAWGYDSARSVVGGWMCSSGHRENIMSCDIAEIGIGIAEGRDGRYYHSQVFACPSGERCSCRGGGDMAPSDDSPFDDEPADDPTSSDDTPFGDLFPGFYKYHGGESQPTETSNPNYHSLPFSRYSHGRDEKSEMHGMPESTNTHFVSKDGSLRAEARTGDGYTFGSLRVRNP